MESIKKPEATQWIIARKAILQICHGRNEEQVAELLFELVRRGQLRMRGSFQSERHEDGDGEVFETASENEIVSPHLLANLVMRERHLDWQSGHIRIFGEYRGESGERGHLWLEVIGIEFSKYDLRVHRLDIRESKEPGKPSVPQGKLRKWLEGRTDRKTQNVADLLIQATAAFPEHRVPRDPFRKLLEDIDGPRHAKPNA